MLGADRSVACVPSFIYKLTFYKSCQIVVLFIKPEGCKCVFKRVLAPHQAGLHWTLCYCPICKYPADGAKPWQPPSGHHLLGRTVSERSDWK